MNRVFNILLEIAGWLLIVASPLLLTVSVSLYLYLRFPSKAVLIFAIVLSVAGLVSGIIWASNIYRKKGTMRFLAELSATPDIEDQFEREKRMGDEDMSDEDKPIN